MQVVPNIIKNEQHRKGTTWTEERHMNFRNKMLGKEPWNKGKKNCYTVQQKENMLIGQLAYFSSSDGIIRRKKMSENAKGKPSPMKGKHHSEKTKKKMSENARNRLVPPAKGKHYSEETKKNMSDAKIEYYKTHEHPMLWKQHSEKTKIKMRVSQQKRQKEFPVSEVTKEKHRQNYFKRSKEGRTFKETKLEKTVYNFLRNKLQTKEIKKQFCLSYKGIGNKYFDLYLPEFNLLIEVDGTYWHQSNKSKLNDAIKRLMAYHYGYEIISIKESQINDGSYRRLLKKKLYELL